jgi:hypothetical protein
MKPVEHGSGTFLVPTMFTAKNMKAFWDTAPCSLVEVDRRTRRDVERSGRGIL